MKNSVVIIDYGMGNINSIKKKLKKFCVDAIVSSDPEIIQNSEKYVLPGVGHFARAMESLEKMDLVNLLNNEVLIKKKPILGICLGMQLMAKSSEEGHVAGLGWCDAEVVKFQVKDSLQFKIPQIGWNQIQLLKSSSLMKNVPDLSEFYFVHSYYFKANKRADVLSETVYETNYVSAIEKDNIFGVQFHPEKSHDIGDVLLNNFVNL